MTVMKATLALVASALAACGSTSATTEAPTTAEKRHVIVLSIDGMTPATYLEPDAHGLRVPRLRQMAATGAFATGVESVFPSVTYPAHTTIATGVTPAGHGITTNRTFDPTNQNQGGWYWYSEDIRHPTLWDRAREANRRTALVNWPVTVGAVADFNVPEVWRAGTDDDVKLARALTTPRGFLDEVSAAYPEFDKLFTPPDVRDAATGDILEHLIRAHQPELIMAHIWWVDEMQHRHGLWSREGNAAIEIADAQIDRLVRATEAAGIADRTTFIIVSDHGFAAISREVQPNAMLRAAGLIELDEGGAIKRWRANAIANGGIATIYMAPDATDDERAAVRRLFRERAGQPADSGIARVYDPTEIARLGGDPRAALAIEAAPGFAFGRRFRGDAITATTSAATHGFDPRRADMAASLVIWGPGVGTRELGAVRLVDVAPTVAGLLSLPPAAGAGTDLLAGKGVVSRR